MGDFGPDKIILILLVVLLLFGAKRLPELGRSLGKGIREFKGSLSGVRDAIDDPARQDRVDAGRADVARPADAEPAKEPRRLIS